VLELVFAEFKPERGFILLGGGIDGDPMKPAVVKYRTPPKEKDEQQFHVSRTIIKHAVEKAEGVLSTNAMNDPRFASGDSVQRLRIRSAICSPIRFGERTFGAIYVDSSIANYTFTTEQLALLNAIGQHTAWPSPTPTSTPRSSRPSGSRPSARPSPVSRTRSRTSSRACGAGPMSSRWA
jgi:hypothetical protein